MTTQVPVPYASTPPVPRSGHCSALDEDNGVWYVYGGLGARRYGDLWCFCFESREWRAVDTRGEAPIPRSKASLVRYKDQLLLFGGWGIGHRNSGDAKLNDLWRITIGEWEWRRVDVKGNSPPPRSSHSCTLIGSRMYLFGGIGSQKYSDLWCFDFPSSTWRQLATSSAPGKRSSYGGLHFYRGCLLVVGGLGCGQFNDTWTLDLESYPLVWKQLACTGEIPSKRGRHAAGIVGDKLLVMGGTNLRKSHADVYTLDLTSGVWVQHKTGSRFLPRDSAVSCVWNDELIIHGGCNNLKVWYSDMWSFGYSDTLRSDDVLESIPSETFTSDDVQDDEDELAGAHE